MKKLPNTLWVVCENEGTNYEFLSAEKNFTRFDAGSVVGEYTLTALHKKRVFHKLDVQTKNKRT